MSVTVVLMSMTTAVLMSVTAVLTSVTQDKQQRCPDVYDSGQQLTTAISLYTTILLTRSFATSPQTKIEFAGV